MVPLRGATMHVIKRFLQPLQASPGDCAVYALVSDGGTVRLVWEGIRRQPSIGDATVSSSVVDLLALMANGSSVATVTEYYLVRKNSRGVEQEVRVQIFDTHREGGTRYHVRATSEEGKTASGNSAPTLEAALAFVHWERLD